MIHGTDTYEWLPGEYYLLHKVNVLISDERNGTHEIIGFDQHAGHYTMQHYDNKGNSGFITVTCEQGVWRFFSENLRFTGRFSNDYLEFSDVWEQSSDGITRSHFIDTSLTKV